MSILSSEKTKNTFSRKGNIMVSTSFVNESNKFREYKDFRIETDSYVLMTKPMFDRLIEIADRHGECIYPTKRYRKHGRYI